MLVLQLKAYWELFWLHRNENLPCVYILLETNSVILCHKWMDSLSKTISVKAKEVTTMNIS